MYNVSYNQEPHLIKGKAKLDWERIPETEKNKLSFFRLVETEDITMRMQ